MRHPQRERPSVPLYSQTRRIAACTQSKFDRAKISSEGIAGPEPFASDVVEDASLDAASSMRSSGGLKFPRPLAYVRREGAMWCETLKDSRVKWFAIWISAGKRGQLESSRGASRLCLLSDVSHQCMGSRSPATTSFDMNQDLLLGGDTACTSNSEFFPSCGITEGRNNERMPSVCMLEQVVVTRGVGGSRRTGARVRKPKKAKTPLTAIFFHPSTSKLSAYCL